MYSLGFQDSYSTDWRLSGEFVRVSDVFVRLSGEL
jgi:hypothetical protein